MKEINKMESSRATLSTINELDQVSSWAADVAKEMAPVLERLISGAEAVMFCEKKVATARDATHAAIDLLRDVTRECITRIKEIKKNVHRSDK